MSAQATRRPVRKFNPGTFQSDAEVKARFAVRGREFGHAMEALRGNIGAESCQHILVAGPRGFGKTMLLARIEGELRNDPELSAALLPVRFAEESQEVFGIADFWLEALFHLARACAARDPALAAELRETHTDLAAHWTDRSVAERARAAVLEAARLLDRQLVLMVENLQDLDEDAGADFGWQLRETLQTRPEIVLLATATSEFGSLRDAREPFFELFRAFRLERLATADCARLWESVTGRATTEREIRPLEILTGGNPRLLVIVAEFAGHGSLRRLLDELVALVDEHTEYFRGHLDALAKTERRVYLAAIDLWRPSTAAEIAARARMDIRTVSSLLKRLMDRGAVVAEGTGRRRRYAAAERLYCIYYKLRRERDEAALVHSLIRFMAAFYVDAELADMARGWRDEISDAPGTVEGIRRAMEEAPDKAHILALALPSEEAVLDEGDPLAEAQDFLRNKDFAAAIEVFDRFIMRFGDSSDQNVRLWVAIAWANKGGALRSFGDRAAALETHNEMIARFGEDGDSDIRAWVAWASLDRALMYAQIGDRERAMETFRLAYTRFKHHHERTVAFLTQTAVPLLIASGISERAVLEILSGDPAKAAALEPLIVALRLRLGEEPRAPEIVLEVARDVNEHIDKVVAETRAGAA